MFYKKSLRKSFLVKLIFSSLILILTFSSLLYLYIENSVYEEKHQELLIYAQNITNNKLITQTDEHIFNENLLSLKFEMIALKTKQKNIAMYERTQGKYTYLTLLYPYNINEMTYVKVTKEITQTKHLLDKIFHYIFIINLASFLIVIVYALALSKMLVMPLKSLTAKLSNMNEHLIKPIKIETLPLEFEPLGLTINHLILRIQNFVKYQKELFIGTAHELKTPLAVIKLKNQVTLIKERTPQEYIEALKTTNKTIDEMNIIVSNILKIGRQEGAQLDKPIEADVIELLQKKADDFQLLAQSENKQLIVNLKPNAFMANLQVSLLNQIIQNFLQNALKFTPKEKKIILQSSQDDVGLLIEVIDEGCGIDESMDFFAPFKRQGNKQGVGLGLFLAKSAADALGGNIKLENRKDEIEGTIASLQLNSKLSCILPLKS